jgi:LysR family transcriptional regulator, glycine cleavage system transcriptional activator
MPDPDWLHFPPLSSLRAFEAAARLNGFSTAARALNVTHAAVAQQVRALEELLGTPLIHREGRSMRLTPEGSRLSAALTDGFGSMQGTITAIRARREGDPVTVTITPDFASQWLMPRLWKFWEEHPNITVSLRPDHRILDLRREGIDLGIRFGNGGWPGVDAEFLVSARYMVVGAPSLLGEAHNLTPEQMRDMPWVGEENWPERANWLRAMGLEPGKLDMTNFATEELALAAARQGYGLHVESAALIEQDLADGRLRAVFDPKQDRPGYFIVMPPGLQRSAARTFIRWLKATA